jgi:hypothetical protein
MGIRTDEVETNITNTKAAKTAPKRTRKTKPPLARKVKSGEPKDVYLQLCEDVATRMNDTCSGRDYAAMSKTFMAAYEEYIKANDADEVKDAEAIKKEAEASSPIAKAQAQFKIVSVPKKVVNQ